MPTMKSMERSRAKVPLTCLFAAYLLGLLYFLFFCENYGHGGAGEYSYNLVPFKEILRYLRYGGILGTRAVVINLLGNVIAFLPFGVLLPLLFRPFRRIWRTVLLSFVFSALVECTQLIFHVGCFDVDDMILNTLGGLAGFLLFLAGMRISIRRTGGKE